MCEQNIPIILLFISVDLTKINQTCTFGGLTSVILCKKSKKVSIYDYITIYLILLLHTTYFSCIFAKNNKIIYQLNYRKGMIMKRLLMTLFCALSLAGYALAQSGGVHGTVVDESGEPVIGASVFVKGSKTGAITDVNGKFSLNTSTGKPLVITYIGYDKKEVKAQDGMKIVITESSHQLEGVVVTGMQKMDKRLFTGSTTKIDADKAILDGVADISRSLEGRAAGVSVQNVSGTFGTAPKIRVRGATSIYGSSTPLWVVDGVIMENVTEVAADGLTFLWIIQTPNPPPEP